MNRRLRNFGLAAALAGAIPLAGCFPKIMNATNLMEVYFVLLGGDLPPALTVAATAPKTKIDTAINLHFSADVGGLDGTYDVTFDDGDGTTYGTFSGTTTVKRGRFITIKDDGSEGLLSMVNAIASTQAGGNITIEKARAKVSAYQTPGGVSVVYKGKITFKGVVADGPNAGRKLRAGKFALAGVYPAIE